MRGARYRSHSAVDLRSTSESMGLSEDFVAGHEARVESAKLRATSESSNGRLSAADRLRLLKGRVVAKQAGGPSAPSGVLVDGVSPSSLLGPAE